MPRRNRVAPAGYVYHVMNRAAGRLVLFECPADYDAFLRLLWSAQRRTGIRIIAYCLMPNHWHILLWPETDKSVTRFMHWLTTTHASRWRQTHETVGRGAVYQSRFRCVPIQSGHHLFVVWRYVERNPLRARIVAEAHAWPWSSLSREHRCSGQRPELGPFPVALPPDWLHRVNRPQTAEEVAAVRGALAEGRPFGDPSWTEATLQTMGWRARGRPKRGRTPLFDDSERKGVRPLFHT
jgi:putative transposase